MKTFYLQDFYVHLHKFANDAVLGQLVLIAFPISIDSADLFLHNKFPLHLVA